MNGIPYPKTLTLALALTAAPLLAVAAEVEVSYSDPESFTDMGDGFGFDQRTFDRFSKEMEKKLREVADRHLPEDAQLAVEFRNVDLAGEVEPWRVDAQDVRVVREIYPPSMKFHFKVTDGSGETIREGLAQVTDQTFTWNVNRSMESRDSFYHEKELIEGWGRKALRNIDSASGS